MEFIPDKRHLWGGITAALLLCVWLLYQGMSNQGSAFYEPEHSGHPKGSAYEADCAECHTVAWKEVENASCVVCHQKRAPRRTSPIPGKADLKKTEDTASDKLHMLAAQQSCSSCHIEHRPSELDRLLKLKPPERKLAKGYPEEIHAFIPKNLSGEASCIACHTQAELDAPHEKPAAAAPAPAPEAPAAE